MIRPAFPLLGAVLVPLLAFSLSLRASNDEDESTEPQVSGGIELPVWQVGEARESFDVRIWPNEVVIWLEQENLRDLIADPEIPEEERTELKRVLARQLAWSST